MGVDTAVSGANVATGDKRQDDVDDLATAEKNLKKAIEINPADARTMLLLGAFYERGIGFEAMTTEAACRTFNVLVSEGRTAVAALIID